MFVVRLFPLPVKAKTESKMAPRRALTVKELFPMSFTLGSKFFTRKPLGLDLMPRCFRMGV